MPRTFGKTTIVILSEELYNSDVVTPLDMVHCPDSMTFMKIEEIDGPTMAQLLIDENEDPGFFQLEVDGEDLYPEEDDEDEDEDPDEDEEE